MRRALLLDTAPGQDLIPRIFDDLDGNALVEFFDLRLDWCNGYPFIHDRFVTYDAFHDLRRYRGNDRHLPLIPRAVQLATERPDPQFHLALDLLLTLIPPDRRCPRPERLSESLLAFRLRTERLSFLPNLTSTWAALAARQRHLFREDDFLRRYTPAQLEVDSDAWKRFHPHPLVHYRGQLIRELPVLGAHWRAHLQRQGARPGEARLIYETRIEGVPYWVWQLPGQSGTAHLHRIVFLRHCAGAYPETGSWDLYRQFHERQSPAEISRRLMRIAHEHTRLIAIDPEGRWLNGSAP